MLWNLNLRLPRWPTKRVLTRSTKSISVAVELADLPLLTIWHTGLHCRPVAWHCRTVAWHCRTVACVLTFTLPYVNDWPPCAPSSAGSLTLQHRINLRKKERCWRKRQLAIDFEIFCSYLLLYKTTLKDARTNFVSHQVRECAGDKRALFSLIGGLMGSSSKRSHPTRFCDQEIADDLCSFFSSKVSALVSRFAATETSSFSDPAAEELTRPTYPLMEKTRSFSAVYE